MLEYSQGFISDVRVWNGLSWAEFDFSGNLIRQSEPSAIIEAFPADAIPEVVETIKNMRPAPFDSAYLRFNELPEGGRSRNHATGEEENGVSCYALVWDMINHCYKRTGSGLDGAMIAYAISGAPIYFIDGKECGTGSDGEPVLQKARILAVAKFDTDKDGYIIKEG